MTNGQTVHCPLERGRNWNADSVPGTVPHIFISLKDKYCYTSLEEQLTAFYRIRVCSNIFLRKAFLGSGILCKQLVENNL